MPRGSDSSVLLRANSTFANIFIQAPKKNVQVLKIVSHNFTMKVMYGLDFPAHFVVLARIHSSCFLNGYYDNKGWWALALIQAYDVTKITVSFYRRWNLWGYEERIYHSMWWNIVV